MDLNDFFGHAAGRPSDSLDYWRLSQIVLALDATTDGLRSQEGADQMSIELGKHIDTEAAYYLSMQRAMRLAGASTKGEVIAKWGTISMLMTVHLDGMLIGMRYAEEGGHQERPATGERPQG